MCAWKQIKLDSINAKPGCNKTNISIQIGVLSPVHLLVKSNGHCKALAARNKWNITKITIPVKFR